MISRTLGSCNACGSTCRCMVILLIKSDLVLTPDESRWCSMWLVCCHIVVGGWGGAEGGGLKCLPPHAKHILCNSQGQWFIIQCTTNSSDTDREHVLCPQPLISQSDSGCSEKCWSFCSCIIDDCKHACRPETWLALGIKLSRQNALLHWSAQQVRDWIAVSLVSVETDTYFGSAHPKILIWIVQYPPRGSHVESNQYWLLSSVMT